LYSCGIIRYDRDLCGKVVDRDTSRPIPGAVIIGDWSKFQPTVAGATYWPYRVAETSSDNNGDFCLKGSGLVFFVDDPWIIVFKSGYDHLDDFKHNHKERGIYLKERGTSPYDANKVIWSWDRALIQLKPLSIEQREESYRKPDHHSFSISSDSPQIQMFQAELEKERDAISEWRYQRTKALTEPSSKVDPFFLRR